MAAGQLDLLIEQGATFRRQLLWRMPSADDGTPGAPYDLTGCKARMQIKANATGEPLVSLTTENGGLILGGTAGTVVINMTPAETWVLTRRRALYDLYIDFPGGDAVRLVTGKVNIDDSITARVVT